MLPGRILVGAYPSSLDDVLNAEILKSILQLGITTFVCLQQGSSLATACVLVCRRVVPAPCTGPDVPPSSIYVTVFVVTPSRGRV